MSGGPPALRVAPATLACVRLRARQSWSRCQGDSVAVYASPGGRQTHSLSSPDGYGVARVFLVTGRQGGWLRALLPVRPNGASGWIKASSVSLLRNDYAVSAERGAHRLAVTKNGRVVLRLRAGVGGSRTPTPVGALLRDGDAAQRRRSTQLYGPFALGLSGFSEVLFHFKQGPGQIAIHGTGDPSTIGPDASNGCIHVSNRDVSRLAALLPLGTPVTIVD